MQLALPCLAQIQTRLGAFRAIKGGLTRATGEIGKVRGKVETLEGELTADLHQLNEILCGDDAESADDNLW